MEGGERPAGRFTPNQGGTTECVKPSSLTLEGAEGFCVFRRGRE
jgi:hypothetical protein